MSQLDLETISRLSPEQLGAIAEAYMSPNKGLYMGGYIAG